jgi:putative DNA primase/helicase
MSLGAPAADYVATYGWGVLPCQPGDKPPLWGLGWQDASTDPEQIAAWWAAEPQANIGIACAGALVVLDVDGAQGESTLARLEAEHGLLAVTREVVTGHGRHFYFARPDGLGGGWRWGGLELKASGYVLAPPSVHPSGALYTDAGMDEPGAALAALPRWLIACPRPQRPPQPSANGQDPTRLQRAAEAALEGELAKLRGFGRQPGSGRHTALYAAAAALGRHVATGGIAQSIVEAELWAAAGPLLGLAADPETWHQITHGLSQGAVEPYVLRERPQVAPLAPLAPPPQLTTPGALHLRKLTELRMRQVTWLWEQRIPLGKLTVLGGLAGQGKSLLTCWLASRASTGQLDVAEPVAVLIVSAEDDPEDTIMPRVLRTGGDPERVYIADVRQQDAGRDYTRSVSLPGDTPAILRALEVTGAKLVVLDPISGLLDEGVDIYKSQAVRKALGPLKQAAEDLHVAILLVTHVLPKGQGSDPLQRLADSHAFSGLPRSVLIFGPDPEDELGDRGAAKVLMVAKSNIAGPGEHGLGFTIEGGELVGDPATGVGYSASIRLDGASGASVADSLSSGEERSALRQALDFLRSELAAGPVASKTLRAEAEAQGISPRTLVRARGQVCRRAYREGDGPWMTALREPPSTPGVLGTLGTLPEAAGAGRVPTTPRTPRGLVIELYPGDGDEDDGDDEEP